MRELDPSLVCIRPIRSFGVARLVSGVGKGMGAAIVVAAVYGILQSAFHWLLVLGSLPCVFVILGLFLIVINAFVFNANDRLIEDCEIDGCLTTINASLIFF